MGTVGFAKFDDSNYNLALLRWLLNALIAILPDHPESPVWKEKLALLAPFPTDENGLRIAANQSVDISHRHYSHLLALYPLFQLDPDDKNDRDLVDKSVLHWHHIEDGKKLAGYSFSGAASLYAALGRGDDAKAMLEHFLTGKLGSSYMSQNTFYFESGGRNPVIETPLSAAASINQLLLQSWGGKIRVFAAVPTIWKDSVFANLRAEGGFLVSARRQENRTLWVSLKSLAGNPCLLKVPDWIGPLKNAGTRPFTVIDAGPGEYSIDMKAGEEVLLFPAEQKPDVRLTPIPHPQEKSNPYGLKRHDLFPEDHFWPENLPTTPAPPSQK